MFRSVLVGLLVCLSFSGHSASLGDDFVFYDGGRRRLFIPRCLSLSFGTIQYVGELSNEMYRTTQLHGAFAIKFDNRISGSFDVRAQFTHGIIDYYQFETPEDSIDYRFSNSLYMLELGIKYRLNNGVFFSDASRLSPYVYVGLSDIISSADHYASGNSVDFGIPLGWGIDFDVNPALRVGISSTFHYTFTDNLDGWDRTKDGDSKNLMDRLLYTGISVGYRFF